jgi:hypothetical protein
MSEATPPKRRACLRCDRAEHWSDEHRTWIARSKQTPDGTLYCVHEWETTGNYDPFQ